MRLLIELRLLYDPFCVSPEFGLHFFFWQSFFDDVKHLCIYFYIVSRVIKIYFFY